MSKIWLTSDTHWGHKNTMRYCGRPFLTVDICDKYMVAAWNALIKPEDTVYHIGDVAMHTAPMKRILPQLNGRKILIIGNHDLMFPYFLKTRGQKFVDKMTKEYTAAGFAEIHPSGYKLSVFDGNELIDVRLCHFPTKNAYDNHGLKHMEWRPEDDGTLNISGHVHQNWLKRGNNINVGVDVWDFMPITLRHAIHLWKTGPENLDNPHKTRVFLWKIYHTVCWRVRKVIEWFRSKK